MILDDSLHPLDASVGDGVVYPWDQVVNGPYSHTAPGLSAALEHGVVDTRASKPRTKEVPADCRAVEEGKDRLPRDESPWL